ARLGGVMLEQQPRLLLGHVAFQRMKDRGSRGVGLPFEDLVAEQEVIAKLGGQQLREQAVILMSIAALRAEHYLRAAGSAKLIQMVLDSFPMSRCSPVRYIEDNHLEIGTGAECGERIQLLGFAIGAPA